MSLVLCVVSPAFGQESADEKRRFVFGEEDVSGTVQKPQVEYIIARQDTADDEELTLKESFIPRLLKTVETAPF
jgi:hypothetical protein